MSETPDLIILTVVVIHVIFKAKEQEFGLY